MENNNRTFQLTTFHDAVLPQPLTFAPPYANLATDPEGFSRFWQFAHYAFRLPDPAKFPAFPEELQSADRVTVDRFVSSCRELAGYNLMSAHDRVELFPSAKSGAEHRATFSSSEAIRGATVLFRQLYAGDPGSYPKVLPILIKAHQATHDQFTDQRADWLRVWRGVHGKLVQQRIEAIVARKSLRSRSAHESIPVPFENEPPSELFSIYFYGDLIHWGKSRPKHDSLFRDPLMRDLRTLRYLEALVGLAHFYLGISVLLTAAFPKVESED